MTTLVKTLLHTPEQHRFAAAEKSLWPSFRQVQVCSEVGGCYPKCGVETDLNRDVQCRLLAAKGLSPTRQLAVDDVWSARRFTVAS